MTAGPEWSVEFFVDEAGRDPVGEFLRSLDVKTQLRFEWSIEQLRLRNIQAREPLAKHLEGNLWELCEESRTNIYRILYFMFTGRRIVLLHGFQKKTQKTPPREVAIAWSRESSYRSRMHEG